MAGWCGDRDGMLVAVQAAADGFDRPAGHFAGVVAAFAFPAAVGIDGQTALGVALNVVDVADWCVTERIATPPIPKNDQLFEEPIKAAAQRITACQRSTHGRGVQAAPP